MSVLNEFNLDEWAAKGGYSSKDESDNVANNYYATSEQPYSDTTDEDVERLISEIELQNADLTADYDMWIKSGFALCHRYGEAGRELYHRLSRFYPNYTREETDRQYDSCLKSKGSGITINTLFHYAKEAGITINTPHKPHTPQSAVRCSDLNKNSNTLIINDLNEMTEKYKETANCGLCGVADFCAPTFSDKIGVELFPPMLQPIYNLYDEPSVRDMMLNAAITVMGPLVPNYYTYYMDSMKFISNYFVVSAPFAGGKGELALIRKILEPYEEKIRNAYQHEKAEWEDAHNKWEAMGNNSVNRSKRGPEPKQPVETSPVCSGDITEAALCQEISNNNGCIVMMGTELDDVVVMMKNRYGDYSKVLRAGWQNETYTSTRKMDNLHICIRQPRIGFLYAGTTDQLKSFLPSAENGLASRITNYTLKPNYEFKNPFISSGRPKEDVYLAIGKEYAELLEYMEQLSHPVQFVLNAEQGERIFKFFHEEHSRGRLEIGNDYMGFVKRQALNATRLAMTSALLRRYSTRKAKDEPMFNEGEQALTAIDDDVTLALTIQPTLNEHTQIIYEQMKWGEKTTANTSTLRNDEQRLYNSLPNEFTTQEAKDKAESLGINPRSIERWLPKFIRSKMAMQKSKGVYLKCNP